MVEKEKDGKIKNGNSIEYSEIATITVTGSGKVVFNWNDEDNVEMVRVSNIYNFFLFHAMMFCEESISIYKKSKEEILGSVLNVRTAGLFKKPGGGIFEPKKIMERMSKMRFVIEHRNVVMGGSKFDSIMENNDNESLLPYWEVNGDILAFRLPRRVMEILYDNVSKSRNIIKKGNLKLVKEGE